MTFPAVKGQTGIPGHKTASLLKPLPSQKARHTDGNGNRDSSMGVGSIDRVNSDEDLSPPPAARPQIPEGIGEGNPNIPGFDVASSAALPPAVRRALTGESSQEDPTSGADSEKSNLIANLEEFREDLVNLKGRIEKSVNKVTLEEKKKVRQKAMKEIAGFIVKFATVPAPLITVTGLVSSFFKIRRVHSEGIDRVNDYLGLATEQEHMINLLDRILVSIKENQPDVAHVDALTEDHVLNDYAHDVFKTVLEWVKKFIIEKKVFGEPTTIEALSTDINFAQLLLLGLIEQKPPENAKYLKSLMTEPNIEEVTNFERERKIIINRVKELINEMKNKQTAIAEILTENESQFKDLLDQKEKIENDLAAVLSELDSVEELVLKRSENRKKQVKAYLKQKEQLELRLLECLGNVNSPQYQVIKQQRDHNDAVHKDEEMDYTLFLFRQYLNIYFKKNKQKKQEEEVTYLLDFESKYLKTQDQLNKYVIKLEAVVKSLNEPFSTDPGIYLSVLQDEAFLNSISTEDKKFTFKNYPGKQPDNYEVPDGMFGVKELFDAISMANRLTGSCLDLTVSLAKDMATVGSPVLVTEETPIKAPARWCVWDAQQVVFLSHKGEPIHHINKQIVLDIDQSKLELPGQFIQMTPAGNLILSDDSQTYVYNTFGDLSLKCDGSFVSLAGSAFKTSTSEITYLESPGFALAGIVDIQNKVRIPFDGKVAELTDFGFVEKVATYHQNLPKKAALLFQKVRRGYIVREQVRREKEREAQQAREEAARLLAAANDGEVVVKGAKRFCVVS